MCVDVPLALGVAVALSLGVISVLALGGAGGSRSDALALSGAVSGSTGFARGNAGSSLR